MSDNSTFGKALVYTSAGVGVVIGVIQIGEWLAGGKTPSATGLIDVTPSIQSEADIGGTSASTGNTAAPTAEASSPPPLTGTEQELAVRIVDVLALRCEGVSLRDVSATAQTTPASETTSGFDGHYIEGEVVVVADDQPYRVRLQGTGKGPDGARAALSMAVAGLERLILATDGLKDFCKES
ncbi:hypothetical protein ACOXXX_17050 [Thalassococcus sp. BH17M4-6]|uniref:hypothetical protein n=1 Tax=Thalassococcus sp. BH17M4-6 TaxID=3413148 RepID=UPI003BE556BE